LIEYEKSRFSSTDDGFREGPDLAAPRVDIVRNNAILEEY